MKQLIVGLAVVLGGCERAPEQAAAPPAQAPAVLQSEGPVSKPPPVVPLPKDQAEIDRMILAGYTPHANHLHAPGVNECPLTKGNEAVM
ncbi:MAG TPA: hypothetical protein VFK50_01785 [Sphingomicrobium sp.]|nr:hypothetical protein [Sphingomicrobium sp.]